MKRPAKYKGVARLALVAAVIPLFVYSYAISGTVKQRRMAGKYHRQIERLRSEQAGAATPTDIQAIETEMILSGLAVAEMLPFIEAEGLHIEQFSPCVTSDNDGIVLTTGQLSVRGKFTGIVKLIERIENEMPYCKIISSQYRTVKPRNRGSVKTLSCTIYIQQIMADD